MIIVTESSNTPQQTAYQEYRQLVKGNYTGDGWNEKRFKIPTNFGQLSIFCGNGLIFDDYMKRVLNCANILNIVSDFHPDKSKLTQNYLIILN